MTVLFATWVAYVRNIFNIKIVLSLLFDTDLDRINRLHLSHFSFIQKTAQNILDYTDNIDGGQHIHPRHATVFLSQVLQTFFSHVRQTTTGCGRMDHL